MGIYSPKIYKEKVLHQKSGRKNNDTVYWTTSQIGSILKNAVYCGDMVQSKQRNLSYKIHKRVKVPREDWIIVKDTHEPIIERELFDKIQNIIFSRDSRIAKTGELTMFAGHLKCFDCKRGMTRNASPSKKYELEVGKKRYIYYCNTYVRKSHNLCSKHAIRSDKLEEMVFEAIKFHIGLIIDIEKTIKKITKEKDFECEKEMLKNKISDIEIEIEKNKQLKRGLYEDWKEGILSKEEFIAYSKEYEDKITKLISNSENIQNQLNASENTTRKNDDWIEEFKKRKNIKELKKDVIDDLIDNIYVHNDGNITIIFKYQDEYEQALEFIKKNSNDNILIEKCG